MQLILFAVSMWWASCFYISLLPLFLEESSKSINYLLTTQRHILCNKMVTMFQQIHELLPLYHGHAPSRCTFFLKIKVIWGKVLNSLSLSRKQQTLVMPPTFVQSSQFMSKGIATISLLGFHSFWEWELKFSTFWVIDFSIICNVSGFAIQTCHWSISSHTPILGLYKCLTCNKSANEFPMLTHD
jgi:hypothetical protein